MRNVARIGSLIGIVGLLAAGCAAQSDDELSFELRSKSERSIGVDSRIVTARVVDRAALELDRLYDGWLDAYSEIPGSNELVLDAQMYTLPKGTFRVEVASASENLMGLALFYREPGEPLWHPAEAGQFPAADGKVAMLSNWYESLDFTAAGINVLTPGEHRAGSIVSTFMPGIEFSVVPVIGATAQREGRPVRQGYKIRMRASVD
jgi:hypothetical protein